MGSIVAFRPREAKPSTEEEPAGEIIILSTVGLVVAVAVLVACRSGHEDSGPYHIVLRSLGVSDAFVGRFTKGDGASRDQVVALVENYAHSIMSTLLFAEAHPYLMLRPDIGDPA